MDNNEGLLIIRWGRFEGGGVMINYPQIGGVTDLLIVLYLGST